MIDWKAVAIGAVTIGASISGAAFFAGHRDQALDDHEKRIVKLEVVSGTIAAQDVRLARIEEQLKFVNESLARLLAVRK
jgi:hypothetical protein